LTLMVVVPTRLIGPFRQNRLLARNQCARQGIMPPMGGGINHQIGIERGGTLGGKIEINQHHLVAGSFTQCYILGWVVRVVRVGRGVIIRSDGNALVPGGK